MNFSIFVESLTPRELNDLSNAVYVQRKAWARNTCPKATPEEIYEARYDKIKAIKMYRQRTERSLFEAHAVISTL